MKQPHRLPPERSPLDVHKYLVPVAWQPRPARPEGLSGRWSKQRRGRYRWLLWMQHGNVLAASREFFYEEFRWRVDMASWAAGARLLDHNDLGTYYTLDRGILARRGLTPGARLLAALLAAKNRLHRGKVFPGRSLLAGATGVRLDQVDKYRDGLRHAKLIDWGPDPAGSRRRSSHYAVRIPDALEPLDRILIPECVAKQPVSVLSQSAKLVYGVLLAAVFANQRVTMARIASSLGLMARQAWNATDALQRQGLLRVVGRGWSTRYELLEHPWFKTAREEQAARTEQDARRGKQAARRAERAARLALYRA